MPSTYNPLLRLELQATGENATTWGIKTNTNINLLADSIAGATTINVAGSGDYTLSTANGADDESRHSILVLTGLLTGNRNVIVPTSPKNYVVINQTTGAFTLTLKQAAGSGVVITRDGPNLVVCTSTTTQDSIGATPYTKGFLAATSTTPALTALGATSVGAALFVAADTSAARSAIGATTVGSALIIAADTSAARAAIGATTVGSALIVAADASAGRSAISAAASGDITASGLTQATSRLLGRTTAATGAVEEISVGAGLALSAGSLAAGGRAYTEYTTYSALTDTIPADDTIPQSSEGTQILSASITPKNAANRVRVRVIVRGLIQSDASRQGVVALFRGAGTDAIAATCANLYLASQTQSAQTLALEFEDSPGSTSAQTYNVRVGPSGGTLYINGSTSARLLGGAMRATLVLEEIIL